MRETKKLSEIRTDGGTQARAGLDEAKVAEYQERIEAGDRLPALDVVYDGTNYWLWDGFHRHAAALRAGVDAFLVDVRQGTRRDAVRLACGANARHGLPRTPDDKRRAVQTMLEDEEWGKWSDRKIAEECVVSPTFVGKVRASLTVHVDSENPERTYTTRHGTPAVMNTANIGRVGDPGPLKRAIEANIDPSAYEDIRSLQNFVLFWVNPLMPDLPRRIEILDDMKGNRQHSRWLDLQLALGRAGKVFRANDLRQAFHNALDILRQDQSAAEARAVQTALSQPSEPDQDKATEVSRWSFTAPLSRYTVPADDDPPAPVATIPSLVDSVEGFVLAYKDPFDRDTLQIPNPSHTNGTFWQAIKIAFARDGITYKNDAELKIAIKRVFARLKNEPEPDTTYWNQFVPDEDQPAINEPDPPTEEHWAKSNPMSFWVEVDRLGVSRAKVLDFLQPGAKYASELNMTKEQAFARLVDAPRRIDPYNPTQMANGEPVAAAPVLNGEQAQPDSTPLLANEYHHALQSRINGMSLEIRKELKQEFRWSSDWEREKFSGESGLKRLVTGARANVYDCLCDILLASIKRDEANEEAQ